MATERTRALGDKWESHYSLGEERGAKTVSSPTRGRRYYGREWIGGGRNLVSSTREKGGEAESTEQTRGHVTKDPSKYYLDGRQWNSAGLSQSGA